MVGERYKHFVQSFAPEENIDPGAGAPDRVPAGGFTPRVARL